MCPSTRDELLPSRVLDFIHRHDLIPARERIVVGVSGGADSVCLLHLLITLKEQWEGITIQVAHLNHMLRGTDSDADARYVSQLAQQWGVECTIKQHDVRSYQEEHRLSLEAAAREVRYQFLAQVASSTKARRIVLGHTADDQAETLLMHLIRGSGGYGLRGMQPSLVMKPPGIVVRPLLEISRRETRAYCEEHHLAFREDASNRDTFFFRNRIRGELLPLLRNYNPHITTSLLRTARTLSEDYDFLLEQAAQSWDKVVREEGETLAIDIVGMRALHPALQGYLFREAVQHLQGNLWDIDSKHIEMMKGALSLSAGKQITLPQGLRLYVDYDKLRLCYGEDKSGLPILDGEMSLKIPGKTELLGWRVLAFIEDRSAGEQWQQELVGQSSHLLDSGVARASFDLAMTGSRLVVRGWRRGDTFYPLGMSKPKKIQDFMVDAKIPQSWRERVPIVCLPSQVGWVVGWRIDNRVRVTASTKKVLSLEFRKGPLSDDE